MRLSIEQIYQAALQAGFTPDQATTWTAIALAESGGDPQALNPVGERSVGLWQINLAVHSDRWGDLTDPVNNARAAYEISRRGTDMRPWTVTHGSNAGTARDYRAYLDDVAEVTGHAGDPRGVEGYGAPLPDPLAPTASLGAPVPPGPGTTAGEAPAEEVDLLLDPGSAVDTDQDGLTDAFERMVGSDAALADTDRDGLSDAYEAVVSRTGLLLADTDDDALGDSAEVALGTSGTRWDSDDDGISDGAESRFGRDPLVAEDGTLADRGVPPRAVTPQETVPAGGPAVAGDPGDGSRAGAFVQAALAQQGDDYVFGAEAGLDEADPETFDCSELTQWAAHQAGVTIPDGAMYQYLDLKDQDRLMSVDEALRTPGALLFSFSEEPTAGGTRPSGAHVAISLGDGRTIEARGSSYGVDVFDAGDAGERFNYAGMVPEMAGGAPADVESMLAGARAAGVGVRADGSAALTTSGPPPATDPDSDDDGLSDAFEEMVGLDPLSSDTDGDRVSDAEEQLGGRRLLTPEEVRAALEERGLEGSADADRDGLSNRYELRHGFDVHAADTDADGLSDATEVALGTDATALDSDYDGVSDRFEIEVGTDPLAAGDPADGWGLEPGDGSAAGRLAAPVPAVDDISDIGDIGGLD